MNKLTKIALGLCAVKIGIETTNKLQEYFSNLINVKYTAKMEDDLDKIADGKMVWVNLLDSFYTP